MYFLKSGKVAAILSKYNDFRFLKIKEGYYFGELDLLFYNEIRKYTFMATKESELLVLSKKQFKNLFFIEFREIGMSFINNAYLRKKNTRKIYKEAIGFCEANLKNIFSKKSKEKKNEDNEANKDSPEILENNDEKEEENKVIFYLLFFYNIINIRNFL